MEQENFWSRQKNGIFKILADVCLKSSSSEGSAFTSSSERDPSIVSYLDGLGIKLEPGSEAEQAMLLYLAGLKSTYAEYQQRLSLWTISMCLGDTICATPTLRKIKERYPDHPIDVYCRYPDVFRHNKYADKVFTYDPAMEQSGDYGILRTMGYKQNFLMWFSSEKERDVTLEMTNLIDVCSLEALNMTLEDHEKSLYVPVSQDEEQSLLGKIGNYAIDFNKAVVIHPSKTWANRTWPEENWQKLTDTLRADGYHVIAVGKKEPVANERLKTKGNENYGMHPCPNGAINLIDTLSLLETARLLSLCKCVITMDSGILHLALSTDTAIIGMFTVIDPQFRKAWRKNGFDYKFRAVPPNGNCYYCSNAKSVLPVMVRDYTRCPHGLQAPCLPTVEAVYDTFAAMKIYTP